MPSRKLIVLLNAFSKQELQRFKKYLISPYLNENEILTKIFDLLELNPVNEDHSSALKTKQAIWKEVYPLHSYNDGQMRRLLSELMQEALNFLMLERLEKDAIKKQILILNALEYLNLDLHFSSVFRQATIMHQSNLMDANHYFYQHQLEEIQHHHLEKGIYKLKSFENLEQADYYLNCYYIIKKLKYNSDALEYNQSSKIKINIDLLPNFIQWIETSSYFKESIIQAYLFVINMFIKPTNDEYYYHLKKLLKEEAQKLKSTELKTLYIHLVNYCIYKKINIGEITFFLELFDLYKYSLTINNIWVENNLIAPQDYKNIITVGLQVKEFEWTEAFIQNYTPKLPPEERENALTYNLAKVYFAQQHYEKVIEQLREVEYDNLTYALGGKLMLLKTYYELNEYLALDSLVDSFRVYLRRNQTISKEVRQQYLNVLRFIKKLSNVRPGDRGAITKIEQQIHECKNLADKGWIISKVEALKG